ncbi:MAG: rhomboid family intramembrane serine protease [Rhizobiales bacterium]|nr:rhomboid family intramembrane serine protease [Hyphomicrobiales bacterium]
MDSMRDIRRRRTPGVWLIMALNALVFLGLAALQGGFNMSPRLIAEWGGILPIQWMEGEPWRYLTAGFLHFGPLHITANMICLLAWGVPLERLFGTGRFVILFLGSIVAGSIGSVMMHAGPFVGAGASGGVSGLLGALLMLQLTRFVAIPASFFLTNFALNVAVALLAPGVDWQAHLFGFLGGMALTGLMVLLRR